MSQQGETSNKRQQASQQPFVKVESPDDMGYEGALQSDALRQQKRPSARKTETNVLVDSPDDVES